jgi:hypothetical protein
MFHTNKQQTAIIIAHNQNATNLLLFSYTHRAVRAPNALVRLDPKAEIACVMLYEVCVMMHEAFA